MKDLPANIHAELDKTVSDTCSSFGFVIESHSASILLMVITTCFASYADVWPIDRAIANHAACHELLATRPEILTLLQTAHTTGSYAQIRNLPELHTQKQLQEQKYYDIDIFMADKRAYELKVLREAYNKPYLGKFAYDFVNYLVNTDEAIMSSKQSVYAKAISIVQSSGTGKSRMLTEAGKAIFTLPICVRHPKSPGYPASDTVVFDYFAGLNNDNDLSLSGHVAIACFLGAAYNAMHASLRDAQIRDPNSLLEYWNSVMEKPKTRAQFFQTVVNDAKSKRRGILVNPSPRRNDEMEPDAPDFNISKAAQTYYDDYTQYHASTLAEFLSAITSEKFVIVTYFDEAHELKLSYWMLLRLVAHQSRQIPVWYVFMGTQSSLTYFSPAPQNMLSVRLRTELASLLAPYIALGFDQNVVFDNRAQVTVRMGYLQSIEHLSKYGRPMWNAQFLESKEDELIDLAGLKLVGPKFNPENRDHVLAVLSQRVGVETVLVSAEALQLANRGVASHMRLLTGFSHNQRIFYTHSPSEPMLALGAAHLVHNRNEPVLGEVLKTFNRHLCEAGLIEKGLLGELASRILLTVARDSAAPVARNVPDFLKPILLMNFLDKLFGNKMWCDPCRRDFEATFCDTYVNFTHWVVTKDPLPGEPSQQLFANLWARGAALQCCFRQESLDLVIVTYKGSVAANAIFDVENLSAIVVQIKYKCKSDAKAGHALRPIGIPRNINRPLPYIALLMELGNQSNHQTTKSKYLATASPLKGDGMFEAHWRERESAMKALFEYQLCKEEAQKQEQKQRQKQQRQRQKQKQGTHKQETCKQKRVEDPEETNLKQKVDHAQAKMDACNRFSIFVRGASPEVYGVLHKAKIAEEFAHLLDVTMPSPTDQDTTMKYMHPLERLDGSSDYTAWMSVFVNDEGGEDDGGEDDGGEDEGGEDGEGMLMNVDPVVESRNSE